MEEILQAIFRPHHPDARRGPDSLQLGRLVANGRTIDEAIVRNLQGTAEINVHGGPAVAKALLEEMSRLGVTILPAAASAPLSFPPEHPQWDNAAIGLEMLDELGLARSTFAISALTSQWSGGLSRLARDVLKSLRARSASAKDAADRLRAAAAGLQQMRRLLDPAEVVLAGPPNAGKSTLANALVGREVSIVHASPGTTRDWVRELALLSGVPVWVTDTAGIWDRAEGVDAEAVRRARRRVDEADVVVILSQAGRPAKPPWCQCPRVLYVQTQCDVHRPTGQENLAISARTGQGLAELGLAILRLLDLCGVDPAAPRAFTQRQADLLVRAAEAVDRADGSAIASLESLLKG